jgi:hypothetical protein
MMHIELRQMLNKVSMKTNKNPMSIFEWNIMVYTVVSYINASHTPWLERLAFLQEKWTELANSLILFLLSEELGNIIIARKLGMSLTTAGRKKKTSISAQLGLTRRPKPCKPMLIRAQVTTGLNSCWPIWHSWVINRCWQLTDPNVWIADTGAMVHTMSHAAGMHKIKAATADDSITVGNGSNEKAQQVESVTGICCDKYGNRNVQIDSHDSLTFWKV